MRKRIAIAGAIIGTTAGIGIGRPVRTLADLGHRSARGDQAARGRRARPGPERRRDPRDHHRRAARGGLAVAGPDGLRSGRLVQLRPTRHARHERDEDPARIPGDRGRRHRADVADDRVRGSRGRAGSCARPVQRHRPGPEPGGSRRGGRQGRASDKCPPASPPRAHSLAGSPQDFAASWAFALEPLDGGRTRLVERFRVRFDGAGPAFRSIGPVMGFGVFVDGAAPDARHPRAGGADGGRTAHSSRPRPEPTEVKPARSHATGRSVELAPEAEIVAVGA